MNRKARRKVERDARKAHGDVRTALSKRSQRMMAKAERDRKRYARLSQERLVALIEANVQRLNQLKDAYDAGELAAAATDYDPTGESHAPTPEELEDIFRPDEDENDPALD